MLRTIWAWIMSVVIAVLSFFGIITPQPPEPPPHVYGGFPSLHIQANGVPFVHRELWIDSTFTLTCDVNGEFEFENVYGRIRGRGQSSWRRHEEKRGIRVRFDLPQHMLDSYGAHREWVLVANHGDKTLMRNYTAYHLGQLLPGMEWSPFARFVHLYVNDEYMGVYMLADERNLGPGRLDITPHANPAISEYFLEWDWRLYRDGNVEGVDYFRINTSPGGYVFCTRFSTRNRDMLYEIRVPSNTTPGHMEYARYFIERVSRAIRSRDFERISALIDIPSMIDFYIVQELSMNVDSGASSVFMQIRGQGENRRLHMGPIWDFDVAFGNTDWVTNQTPYGFYAEGRSYWYSNLIRTPEFRAALEARWNELIYDAIFETLDHIQQLAIEYEESFERNFLRHEIMGVYVWPNPPRIVEIDTFMGQVDDLVDWITRRTNYLNGRFNS
ncbi:MAG: CotH kinase family protein [Oscillospiraceae bacterium]|nr:CotH kinase family protein [Oscillospiraceae bacterium]